MQVWNVLHAARWKYKTQKWRKNCHLRTIAQLCPAICLQRRRVSRIEKKLLNSNAFSTCPHNMANFGSLTAEIDSVVWGTPANFNGFRVLASLLQRRRSFARCLAVSRADTSYIHFLGPLAPWRNFDRCKIHFTSKSCVLLYWQRYCTSVQQRASAKLCGKVQGIKLRNFRSGRHLYSAGRPSQWELAHILVLV